MGTRRFLAPVVLAGIAAVVARRRRTRPAPQVALPAGSPPAAVDAAPVEEAPPVALPPVVSVPDSALPADPHPRDASRTRDLALGYVSIPAVDDRHRDDLRRQVKRIRRACDALELSLVDLIPDTESDDVTASERPGIRRILRRLARGDAACLVTTSVERLASSAEEWSELLERLDADDIRLVVVDDALDTGLDGGRDEAWALIGRTAPGTVR